MRLAALPALALVMSTLAACAPPEAEEERGTSHSAVTASDVVEPTDDPAERAAVLAKYASIVRPAGAPTDLIDRALLFFDANKARVDNQRFVTVVDFARHSSKKRFFMIDMESGTIASHVVAHGSGSDPNHTGFVQTFSNVSGSNASSEGFYLTAETYESAKNGLSLRIDGVSSTNSNARKRLVVIHGASYVDEGRAIQGRSWGCPAIPHEVRTEVINAIKGGSVLYIAKSKIAAGADAPIPDTEVPETLTPPPDVEIPREPDVTPLPVDPIEPAPLPEADEDTGVAPAPKADKRTRAEVEADEQEPESDPETSPPSKNPSPADREVTMASAGCSAASGAVGRDGASLAGALALVAVAIAARRRRGDEAR